MSEFLALFDEYVKARATLRAMSEEDEARSAWLGHCASLWNRVCDERAALDSGIKAHKARLGFPGRPRDKARDRERLEMLVSPTSRESN